MEAMGVETLLLMCWEEEGYIGKARVPVGNADIDVLAFNSNQKEVRIGEVKAQKSASTVFVFNESDLRELDADDQKLDSYLDQWVGWKKTIPKLWDREGKSQVQWLPDLAHISTIHFAFCANVHVFGERTPLENVLQRSVRDLLNVGDAIAVRAQVLSTLEVATRLITHVRNRECGRRFGDPLRDTLREIVRFLEPTLEGTPRTLEGKKLDKESASKKVRDDTILQLTKAFGFVVSPTDTEGTNA